MILFLGKVYLNSLARIERQMGHGQVLTLVHQNFGQVGGKAILQALANYQEGLDGPVFELNVEVSDSAFTPKRVRVRTSKHSLWERIRFVLTGSI